MCVNRKPVQVPGLNAPLSEKSRINQLTHLLADLAKLSLALLGSALLASLGLAGLGLAVLAVAVLGLCVLGLVGCVAVVDVDVGAGGVGGGCAEGAGHFEGLVVVGCWVFVFGEVFGRWESWFVVVVIVV